MLNDKYLKLAGNVNEVVENTYKMLAEIKNTPGRRYTTNNKKLEFEMGIFNYLGSVDYDEKVLKSCPLCQHEDRDHLEEMILSGELQAAELDRIEDWRSGTTRKHMQNHLGDYRQF